MSDTKETPLRKNSWTAYEDELLKKCVADGLRTKAILPKLPNRTFHAIAARRRHLGLKCARTFSKNDPMTVPQIVKFRMAGWRLEDITRVTGVHPHRLSRLVTLAGIRLPPAQRQRKPNVPYLKRWSVSETERLKRCIAEGMKLKKTCSLFPDRTPLSVKKRFYRMKRDDVQVLVEPRERWRESVVIDKNMSINDMRDRGLKIDEIARVTGQSRVAIYQALNA